MAPIEASPIHQQIICANVFIRRGAEYLMLRRSPNKRYAPNIVHPVGGKVETGENALAGAKREAFEETGLTISNVRLRAVLLDIKPVPGEPYDWLVYHFLADYESGEPRETPEGQLVWLTRDEMAEQDLHPSVRPVIHHILDESVGTTFVTYQYAAHNGKMIVADLDLCAV
jgi:8-oxo-dGTP diphosphatase